MSLLATALRSGAGWKGAAPALQDEAGRTVSWTALPRAVATERERLRRHLPDPKRPVVIHAPQGIAQCLAELALLDLGIPTVVVPRFFTPAQTHHAVAECGAQAILEQAGAQLRIEPTGARAVEGIPAGTARISYTSGSTGAPQGLCLSADHLLAVADAVVRRAGKAEPVRHLAVLPPGLLLETVAGCLATLLAGGTYLPWSEEEVGLAQPFRPDFSRMVAAIAAAQARSLILVPEYLAGVVATLEHSGLRLPHLRIVAVGGARMAPGVLARARAMGLPVRQGYGLTECGSVVALHDGALSSEGSVGTSLGVHDIRIADDGQILIDGPLHLGRIGAPRAPGPLATGDIGHRDAAGNLWIDGRRSNLIITSYGRNISPEWPESLLLEQPAIAQCMVHGEGAAELGALIVPRGTPAEVAAAVERVNQALPAYARIAHWRGVAPFTPAQGMLTSNGRLRRAAIARLHLQEESLDAVL